MVEIISKPIEKKPLWQTILLFFSLFIFLAVIFSYFFINSQQKRAEAYLQELDEKISQERTPERVALEKEILNYQRKIKDFFPLLEKHTLNSKAFEFIEEKCHPKVFFFDVNLDSEASKIALSGQADSFLTLGQQLSILEKDSSVKSLNLSQVSINEKGYVEFGLDLSLDPKVFRY